MTSNSVRLGVLEVLKEHLKGQEADFQSLTRKAEQTAALSTIIIGAAAALGTFNVNQTQFNPQQKAVMLAAVLVYAIVLWFSLVASRPKDWCGYPIDPTDENNVRTVLSMDDDTYEMHFIGALIGCLQCNQKTIDQMANRVKLASYLMVIEVLLVVLVKLV